MPTIETAINVDPPHIVIIGGGLVGVSLALMLTQASAQNTDKLSITLIEKFPLTTQKNISGDHFDARATALSAGSVDIFDRLGVWHQLKANAQAITNIHISDRGHFTNTVLDANDYSVGALGYVIENQHLGQYLLAALQQQAGVNILAPALVKQCQPKQQGATLLVESTIGGQQQTQVLDADVVLIADGADSTLRESLGIAVDITDYQQSAVITNVALAEPHRGVAYERFTEQGPLALLPLDNYADVHRASVVWTRDSSEVERLMLLSDNDFIAELQACFGYRAGRITQVGKRQFYPLTLVQACEQVRSSIVLVGNTAHFLHPVAGQGFNLSLRDCAVLAEVLGSALAQHQVLGSYNTLVNYERQREQDQQLIINLTHSMVKVFSTQKLPFAILRQLGLMSLNAFPAIKKPLAQQLMGRVN